MLPERPQDAASALETAIDRAAKAITEGLTPFQELRNRRSSRTSLVEVLTAMTRELEADQASTTIDGFRLRFVLWSKAHHVKCIQLSRLIS